MGLSNTTWFVIAIVIVLIGVLLVNWERMSARKQVGPDGNGPGPGRAARSDSDIRRVNAINLMKQRPTGFLCHSSGDKERVRKIYRSLTAEGITCWFDEEDLLPGQDWDYEITRAVRSSRFVLACLSTSSTTRAGYVQAELNKALNIADEQPEGAAFLIPVRLEECQVPERLKRWQWVDLYKKGEYERLLRVLQEGQDGG